MAVGVVCVCVCVCVCLCASVRGWCQFSVPRPHACCLCTDFFFPTSYVQSSYEDTTPANSFPGVSTCDVVFKGWVDLFCANRSEVVQVNEALLENVLTTYVVGFRERYHVPVLLNQWGVKRAVSDDRGRLRYVAAALSLFKKYDVHSAWWVWRWEGRSSGDHWGGFEVVHHWAANNSVTVDYPLLSAFNVSWAT